MLRRVISLIIILVVTTAAVRGAVTITIGEGNEVTLPEEYSAPAWTAAWFLEDGTALPAALLRNNSATSVSILSNVGYVYAVLTEAATGKTARTTGVNADRLRTRVATVRLDGTGSAVSFTLINNGVTVKPDFSVEFAGIVAEAPAGKAVVVLPPLSGLVGEYDIKVNFPDRVGALQLDQMGITAIEVDGGCKNLLELSLDGNSLSFAGLPDQLPDKCVVNYGTQRRVHITTLADGITVDLTDQAVDDLKVKWMSESGEPIDEECYRREGWKFVFDNYSGKVWCTMSSAVKGLTLRSTVVSVGADFLPLLTASWAGAAGNAAFSITMEKRGRVMVDDDDPALAEAGEEFWIRVPAKSGTITVMATSPEAVRAIDLEGVGVYELSISENATGLNKLALNGNGFLPGNLPAGIPDGCVVEWGSQPRVELNGLVDMTERWIDLSAIKDVTVEWIDCSTGLTLASDLVTERPKGLFTFAGEVGSVVGKVYSTRYDGLSWETSEVAFPRESAVGTIHATQGTGICRVSRGRIVSMTDGRLSVFTPDGRLRCEIAPREERSLPSGLYIVSGGGVALLVKL